MIHGIFAVEMMPWHCSSTFVFVSYIIIVIRDPTSVEHGPHSAPPYLTAHQPSHHEQPNLP